MRNVITTVAVTASILLMVLVSGCFGPSTSGPPSVLLTASPTTINAGHRTKLTWKSTSADHVDESNFGATSTNGSVYVSPTEDTTYYIIVSKDGIAASCSVTVYISTE